jgi:hypothetical protein
MGPKTTNDEFYKNLMVQISKAIEKEVGREFDRKIEELEMRKNEIVAGVVLHVSKYIDMQSMSDRIVITVREIANDNN